MKRKKVNLAASVERMRKEVMEIVDVAAKAYADAELNDHLGKKRVGLKWIIYDTALCKVREIVGPGVYYTPPEALAVVADADVVTANPPFTTGGWLCAMAKKLNMPPADEPISPGVPKMVRGGRAKKAKAKRKAKGAK